MATGHILPGYGSPIDKLRRVRSAGYPLDKRMLLKIAQETKINQDELDAIRAKARGLWSFKDVQETTYDDHFAERPADELMVIRPTSATRRNKPHPTQVFLTNRLHYIPGFENADTTVGKQAYKVDGSVANEEREHRQTARRKYKGRADSALVTCYRDQYGIKDQLDSRSAQAAEAWLKIADDKDHDNVLNAVEKFRAEECARDQGGGEGSHLQRITGSQEHGYEQRGPDARHSKIHLKMTPQDSRRREAENRKHANSREAGALQNDKQKESEESSSRHGSPNTHEVHGSSITSSNSMSRSRINSHHSDVGLELAVREVTPLAGKIGHFTRNKQAALRGAESASKMGHYTAEKQAGPTGPQSASKMGPSTGRGGGGTRAAQSRLPIRIGHPPSLPPVNKARGLVNLHAEAADITKADERNDKLGQKQPERWAECKVKMGTPREADAQLQKLTAVKCVQQAKARVRPATAYPSMHRWMRYAGTDEADVVGRIVDTQESDLDRGQPGGKPAPTLLSLRRRDIAATANVSTQKPAERPKPSRGDFLIHPDWPPSIYHHRIP